jgi:1,2-diacylglycerol 3-alpha-glucosyltransferase
MDAPLRIAIFSDSILPILNGVSISIDTLVQELRHRGHSVHIFAPNFIKHRETDPNTHRFRAIETPWSKGYPIAYPPFYRMLRTFRKYEFDVIHTHTPWLVGFVGMRWAESHNIPVVSTYHTLYDRYAHYMSMLPRRYIRFRTAKHTNFYYNSVDQIITPTEASHRWLTRHGVTKPVHVIPTGTPRPHLISRAEARLELGIPADQKILLYVGRLAKEKNLENLLEMMSRVSKADSRLRLWLVGDGPYREECLRIAAKKRIGDRVKFAGFVPRAEVDKYYVAADLFTFASVTETQGLVVQEAMQYGLPAVAITGGGASEAITQGVNGMITKNDPELFADQILEVIQDDVLLAKLSDGALKLGRENGIEAMCDGIIEVYRLAIAGHQETIPKEISDNRKPTYH